MSCVNSTTAKDRMVAYLSKKTGYNTFSVKQGRRLFGVKNVGARIAELREDGMAIYTNIVKNGKGEKIAVYRLGSPTTSTRANRFYSRLRSA